MLKRKYAAMIAQSRAVSFIFPTAAVENGVKNVRSGALNAMAQRICNDLHRFSAFGTNRM
jgi:hypothetical protein